MIAEITQMTPATTPSHSGVRQVPSKNRPAHEGEVSAAVDAERAMRRLTAKAKLSSLPLNHLASAVVTATINGSAPIPNTKRAASMVVAEPFISIMTDARKHSTLKMNRETLV